MKKIIDDIGDWIKEQQESKGVKTGSRSMPRAAYLAIQDEVVEAFEAGYNTKVIWDYLQSKNRYPYAFATFHRHAMANKNRALLLKKLDENKKEPSQGKTSPAEKPTGAKIVGDTEFGKLEHVRSPNNDLLK